MEWTRIVKSSFCVIGKEGSTKDGPGFVQKLWNDANANFAEIAPLAKVTKDGRLRGIWGAMTDFTHSFLPWENNFTEGCYLAGVEVRDDAVAPEGWVKWRIPACEFMVTKAEGGNAFPRAVQSLADQGIRLVGAVQEYTTPNDGVTYLYFPVARI